MTDGIDELWPEEQPDRIKPLVIWGEGTSQIRWSYSDAGRLLASCNECGVTVDAEDGVVYLRHRRTCRFAKAHKA